MVYLLHFDRPFEHVQHFVGVARDVQQLERLLADPPNETRAPLILAAYAAGVKFEVGNLWHRDDAWAEKVRRRHHARQFCTTCRPPKYRELR